MTKTKKALTNYQILQLVWSISGGTKSFLKGGDFRLSCIVVAVCTPAWIEPEWWTIALSVLPNLLGFTLGGFAIFLGFGNDAFNETISDADEARSLYLSVSAAFLLFVLFQVAALLFAIAVQATWRPTPPWLMFAVPILKVGNVIAGGVGFFLFIHSIVLSLRAAMRVFRVSRWYNAFLVHSGAQEETEAPPKA